MIGILSLGTALPAHRVEQTAAERWMSEAFEGRPATQRRLRGIYRRSGIETRYSCRSDYLHPPAASRLAPGRPAAEVLGTAGRMDVYEREAPPLAAEAARRALTGLPGGNGDDPVPSITHLVVVTCTGFFAPGLDFVLARELGLDLSVPRLAIGFMGCSAAFNGLRAARDIVLGQPDARVLVVCVELCTLHVQPGERRDDLVAASLFGDGAAACVVGSGAPDGLLFSLEEFLSVVKPDTEDRMAWRVGDHGFDLRLSARIPAELAEAVPTALRRLFGDDRPAFWAVHPGGRAIVERLASILDLAPSDVAPSFEVLRRFGNLSSATILFVLEEIARTVPPAGKPGVMMAFGPGLVIEMARVSRPVPAADAVLAGARIARGSPA